MELKTKGEEAFVPVKGLVGKLTWTHGADFDLAVLFEPRTGEAGLVYFGDKGKDLNTFPYMVLSGDAGVGDRAGNNEEVVKIGKLDDMKKIHVLCWDYKAVQGGTKARCAGTDVKLTITDDQGQTYAVKLDTGETANVAIVATIDNTNPIGAKLINTSKVGTMKRWSKDAFVDLLAIVNAP